MLALGRSKNVGQVRTQRATYLNCGKLLTLLSQETLGYQADTGNLSVASAKVEGTRLVYVFTQVGLTYVLRTREWGLCTSFGHTSGKNIKGMGQSASKRLSLSRSREVW